MTVATNILDATLPTELQGVVTFETPAHPVAATAAQSEERPMDALTIEQVRAEAVQAATALLAQKDAQHAVAENIAALTAKASKAEAAVEAANKTVADLTAQLATAKEKADKDEKDGKDFVAKSKKDKDDADKAKAELEKTNAELQKQLTEIKVQKVVAERTQAIATAGIAGLKPDRFVALTESGALKVSDEDFTASLAELKAVAGATKPAGTAPGTRAPAAAAAAAAPVPAQPDTNAAAAFTAAAAALAAATPAPSEGGRKRFASIGASDAQQSGSYAALSA